MLINFNMERLEKLLYDFYTLTGFIVSIWDSEFNQLSSQPKEMRSFCRYIKSSKEGNLRCFLSDKKICLEAAKTGKPATHCCHAGLLDTAVPIKFKNNVIGYMMFGQVTDQKEHKLTATLKKLSRDLGLDYEILLDNYSELENYDKEKIDSAANILKMATRYLWLSEYIEIGYNTTASQVDDYIRTHINENLSIKSICDNLGISKNKLYEISHKWFDMSIGDYISSVRIKEAKRLLTTTDYPVSQIGTMVGIKDYNYFTKFFKTHVGYPPLKYRKGYHYNLSDD